MNELNFYEELLDLPKLKIIRVDKEARRIIFYCTYVEDTGQCPVCHEQTTKINQVEKFKFRDLKISDKEIWLHLQLPQFHCMDCDRYFFVHPDWVMPGKSYTRRQAKWIFEVCQQQSFSQAAVLLDMSRKTVERTYYAYVKQNLNLTQKYAQVRRLGIDEVAHKKGKKSYVCVLTDLDRGIQLDILADRKKETLVAHFQALGEEFCNQIEVVSCDIWRTYINVAKELFPNCQIVIDRFHVVKALNSVLDTYRKELRREFSKEEYYKSLKWILYKRHEKCNQEEKEMLRNAFNKSWKLEELYELRKSFNSAFDTAPNKSNLKRTLHAWKKHAEKLDYDPLNAFIKTLNRWKNEIATFADLRLSNATTEGLNNYLRYFKRISFGLPNFEHMRLRVLAAQM